MRCLPPQIPFLLKVYFTTTRMDNYYQTLVAMAPQTWNRVHDSRSFSEFVVKKITGYLLFAYHSESILIREEAEASGVNP